MTWISGITSRNAASSSRTIVQLWREQQFRAYFSGALLNEIADTLLELGLPNSEVTELMALFCSNPKYIVPIRHQRIGCTDPNDDHLFETALITKSAYVVSRDRAVLHPPALVATYLEEHNIRLLSPLSFMEILLGSMTNTEA